jgi:hypothetical protein
MSAPPANRSAAVPGARPDVVPLPPLDLRGRDPGDFPDGDFPGREAVFTLKGTKVEMTVCWCPPADGIPGFWIAKHLVSQRQWTAVMKSNPSRRGKGDNFPVDSVSWNDAQEFCKKTGLRLPTERQWEYACRAGTKGKYAVGAGDAINSQWANFNGTHPDGSGEAAFRWLYRERTISVGSFPPNAWGLHDMHGQLSQWCQDLDTWGNVLRGSNWLDSAHSMGVVSRREEQRETAFEVFGFRPCSKDGNREIYDRILERFAFTKEPAEAIRVLPRDRFST